jgi:23S rRNA pseudouridine2605 synthase
MRINKFVAGATGMSRRAADTAVQAGRVTINGVPAQLSDTVIPDNVVTLDGQPIIYAAEHQTILVNKPVGYVVSREGQGSKTVYGLLPSELHKLKPIGRLDKDSSGLLLLTDDGELAHQLTHPSFQKVKIYEVELDHPLQPLHRQMISERGLQLDDGPSRLQLDRLHDGDDTQWLVTMHEGRNRQIRRTFSALGYTVTGLHRISFGAYQLGNLAPGAWQALTPRQADAPDPRPADAA